MSIQKAQPLICDARVLTSSSNEGSMPHSLVYASRPYIALYAPGLVLLKSMRDCIAFSLVFSVCLRSLQNQTRFIVQAACQTHENRSIEQPDENATPPGASGGTITPSLIGPSSKLECSA